MTASVPRSATAAIRRDAAVGQNSCTASRFARSTLPAGTGVVRLLDTAMLVYLDALTAATPDPGHDHLTRPLPLLRGTPHQSAMRMASLRFATGIHVRGAASSLRSVIDGFLLLWSWLPATFPYKRVDA